MSKNCMLIASLKISEIFKIFYWYLNNVKN